MLAFQAWVVRKDLPLGTFVRGVIPFCVIGAAMFAAIRLLARALGAGAATLPGLLGEVALGGTIYLTLSYTWCWATKSAELKRILPRVARW